jgi:hypothetical protein
VQLLEAFLTMSVAQSPLPKHPPQQPTQHTTHNLPPHAAADASRGGFSDYFNDAVFAPAALHEPTQHAACHAASGAACLATDCTADGAAD